MFAKRCLFSAVLAVPMMVTTAAAEPLDISGWTVESYAAIPGFSPASWNVLGPTSVRQTVNGQPSFFVSNFSFYNDELSFKMSATATDDDYIGFAVGYKNGDTSNGGAGYYIVDWRRADQYYDFATGAGQDTIGNIAKTGLAVSHVQGLPTPDEFWNHDGQDGNPFGTVDELARGATLANTGWTPNSVYDVRVRYGDDGLQVYIDGSLELDLLGDFASGQFAFYNFSQGEATYSDVRLGTGGSSDPEVPEPASVAVWALGAVGLFVVHRRRRLARG